MTVLLLPVSLHFSPPPCPSPLKGEGIWFSLPSPPPSRGRVLYGLPLKEEGIWLFPSLEGRLDSL